MPNFLLLKQSCDKIETNMERWDYKCNKSWGKVGKPKEEYGGHGMAKVHGGRTWGFMSMGIGIYANGRYAWTWGHIGTRTNCCMAYWVGFTQDKSEFTCTGAME